MSYIYPSFDTLLNIMAKFCYLYTLDIIHLQSRITLIGLLMVSDAKMERAKEQKRAKGVIFLSNKWDVVRKFG